MYPSAAATLLHVLGLVRVAVVAALADVEQDVEREVFLLEEQLEEQAVEAGVDVPVDEAEVVADDVVAVVGELDALPAPLAPPLALHLAGQHLARHDVELVEPGHERRVEQHAERRARRRRRRGRRQFRAVDVVRSRVCNASFRPLLTCQPCTRGATARRRRVRARRRACSAVGVVQRLGGALPADRAAAVGHARRRARSPARACRRVSSTMQPAPSAASIAATQQ